MCAFFSGYIIEPANCQSLIPVNRRQALVGMMFGAGAANRQDVPVRLRLDRAGQLEDIRRAAALAVTGKTRRLLAGNRV